MINKMNLVRLVVFVVAILASVPLYMAGKYFYYVSLFAESIERREIIPAREHLQEIKYYYNAAKRIPFGEYLADKYIFNEAWYFENAYNYTRGDFDLVINELDGRQDFKAQHLVANSLFKNSRKEFRSTDDKEKQAKIVDDVTEEIAPRYERSLKMMPEDVSYLDRFKDQFNFDLLSNPASAAAALGNEEKMPVYILGIPGEGDEGLGLKGKGDGEDGDLFDTTIPQPGDPPRKKRG